MAALAVVSLAGDDGLEPQALAGNFMVGSADCLQQVRQRIIGQVFSHAGGGGNPEKIYRVLKTGLCTSASRSLPNMRVLADKYMRQTFPDGAMNVNLA